jgi:hypothetical protein
MLLVSGNILASIRQEAAALKFRSLPALASNLVKAHVLRLYVNHLVSHQHLDTLHSQQRKSCVPSISTGIYILLLTSPLLSLHRATTPQTRFVGDTTQSSLKKWRGRKNVLAKRTNAHNAISVTNFFTHNLPKLVLWNSRNSLRFRYIHNDNSKNNQKYLKPQSNN